MKVKFSIDKVLYPKSSVLEVGEFSLLACKLLDQYSGTAIKLKKPYNNFVISCYTPMLFIMGKEYTAEVTEEESRYGYTYVLKKLELEEKRELSESEKRAFIESVFTPNQVIALYNQYDDPYTLIENKDTDKLVEVKGIGVKSVQKIYKKFEANQRYTPLLIALSEYELSKAMMDALLDHYGTPERVIQVVNENVYILAEDVNGIGFLKADKIALSKGMALNDQKRLQAFMRFYLLDQGQNGNSWIQPKEMWKQIPASLGVKFSNDELKEALYALHDKKVIYWNENKTRIGLSYYYNLEKSIYNHLQRIEKSPEQYYKRDINLEQEAIKESEKELGFEFTDEQINAIESILNNQVSILTAYSGCGKSCLTRTLCNCYKKQGQEVVLCALSGKAAARLYEVTGFAGKTIHRTLAYSQETGTFEFNETNKLNRPIFIVDEASFLSGELFLSLLKAIPDGAKLLLVGDDKQLPPIGGCNIFFDMINSHKINVARLTKIHRQAQKSGIIVASKNVREGKQLVPSHYVGRQIQSELKDFYLDVYDDKLVSRPKLMDYYKKLVKNLQDTAKTQIILATKTKGDCNTFDINNEIQEYLNPPKFGVPQLQRTMNGKPLCFRLGDRVINRQNNYRATIYDEKEHDDEEETKTTEVFNGFCGFITKVLKNQIVVKFDLIPEEIVFSYGELKNLELAYALTVHLFQGSQVENVIYLIDNTSYIMNTRELVYTAITRASKMCFLLAQNQALQHAINTCSVINKQTWLKDLLTGAEI